MTDLPLVLLHAFPIDARMWDDVRAPLAEHTRVITPDQRGLGRSPMPLTDRAPSLDDAARDVVALLDRLGIERAVLGGCSMGGYVTMAALRIAPERVGGVVLIDTKASADADEARANRLAMADRVESEGVGFLPEAMMGALVGRTTRQRRPEVVRRVRELILEQPPAGVAWAQRAMAVREDATGLLRDADVPAVVVVGEEDTVNPPEVAREFADTLPRGELVVLPEAGHLAPLEAPAGVIDAIARVLERAR